LLTCDVKTSGSDIKLNATSIVDLDQAIAKVGKGLKVFIRNEEGLEALKHALSNGVEGRSQIRLVMGINMQQSVEMALPGNYLISADIRSKIEAVPGVIGLNDI